MHYKVKTPITISRLMARGGSCDEFKKNLNIFINMDFKMREVDLWEEIDIVDIVPCFRYYPLWEDWLVDNGFIEEQRKFYHIGQYFIHPKFPKSVMSISRTAINIVNVLVHNLTGTYMDSNRLTMDGMQVENQTAITTAEMYKLTGWDPYELEQIRFCDIEVKSKEGQ